MKSLFDLTLPTTPLERTARDLAEYAHCDLYGAAGEIHRRKYTNEPYVNHLAEVVTILRSVKAPPRMLAAAWLHDTLEDTRLSRAELVKSVGRKVADMVDALTDVNDPALSRAARKEQTKARLAAASAQVQSIKLADVISNTRSIAEHDKKFAPVYLAEKDALLAVLALRGNPRLWLRARRSVDAAFAELAAGSRHSA